MTRDSILSSSTLVLVRVRGDVMQGTVEGWTGTGDDVDEILVKITDGCYCSRSCCSGEYTFVGEFSWESIMVAMGDDACLYEDEAYKSECDDAAIMRAETAYMR